MSSLRFFRINEIVSDWLERKRKWQTHSYKVCIKLKAMDDKMFTLIARLLTGPIIIAWKKVARWFRMRFIVAEQYLSETSFLYENCLCKILSQKNDTVKPISKNFLQLF